MRRIFVWIVFMTLCRNATCQVFNLSGCVQDSISGESLPYSVIQLLDHNNHSVFNGVVTNEDGTFSFENVKLNLADYHLVCSHIGYEKYIQFLKVDGTDKNLGTIYLGSQPELLGEVTITASPNIQYVDKKNYVVTEQLLSNVAVSTDLLRKIPELMVDELLRTVTIKGKENVLVLINGIDTGVSADMRTINFRDIETIEIVSTTSSGTDVQYDGIINIILKSKIRQGLSIDSEVTAMINWNSSDLHAGFIWGKDKVRASLSYTNRYRALPFDVRQIRVNNDSGISYTEKGHSPDPLERSHNVLLNLDYHISSKDFFNVTTSTKFFDRDRDIHNKVYRTVDGVETELPGFITQNKTNIATGNYTLFYRHLMKKSTDYLSLNMNYNFNNTEYDTETLYDDGKLLVNNEPSDKHAVNAKVEYNNKINDLFRLNVAGQWYFQNYSATLNNKPDEGSLRNHRYNGHADLFFTFNSYRIMLGFKAEMDKITFNKSEYGSHSQAIIQPQLTINKKINSIHNVTLSYRRRPYYPSPWQLAPYEVNVNDKTINKGNPDLKPQIYNTVNLYHTLDTDKNIFLRTTAYLTHCNDKIILLPFFDEELVSITMPSNKGLYNRIGLKFNGSLWIKGFIQLDPVFDFFYEKMKTNQVVNDVFSQNLGGSIMVWLPAGFGFGAYGSYMGKRVIEGGNRNEKYSIDAIFIVKRFEKINLNLFAGYQYPLNSSEISNTFNDNVWQQEYYKSHANGFILRANFYFNSGRKTKMERVKTYFDTDTRE